MWLSQHRVFAASAVIPCAILILALLFASAAQAEKHQLPLFVGETSAGQVGVLRIINLSDDAGILALHAIDDSGIRSTSATLTVGPRRAVELDAADLSLGNSEKHLSGGLGSLSGDRRLEFDTDLPVQFLAYLRSSGGGLTLLHDRVRRKSVPNGGFEFRVELFNSAQDMVVRNRLRLVNPGELPATVSISARDDAGAEAVGGRVDLTLPAGNAVSLTAQQLESGDSRVSGQLGAGAGSWRLFVSSDQPIEVMNLAHTSTGALVNLSTVGLQGLAPEDAVAFSDRFADVLIESRSRGETITLDVLSADRFMEISDSDSRAGGYAYQRSAPNAGRLSKAFDDGEQCDFLFYFAATTEGWFASDCFDSDNLYSDWWGGVWSVASQGDTPPFNSLPTFGLGGAPSAQTYLLGTPIVALMLPPATGGDGTLTYSLTPDIPGLTFNPATRQLTGTPSAVGTYSMTYMVTDFDGDTATLMFTIRVTAPGGGSSEGDLGDCWVGLIVRPGQSCTYPGTEDAFSVGADGRGSFLVVSSARAINISNGTYLGRRYDFRAFHQGDGAWQIERIEGDSTPGTGGGGGGSDTSPAFTQGSAPANQTYKLGTPIAPLTLPTAIGGDGQLTYSLTPGVPGLEFNPTTRELSGTPNSAGTYTMSYSVTDEDGDADSLTFSIEVESSPDDPDRPIQSDVLRASGCGDGSYVDDPDTNADLVSDCRALVAFANVIAARSELPPHHILRQWGVGTQEKLSSWRGIEVSSGRVTRISLARRGLQGVIPSSLGKLAGLRVLELEGNRLTGVIPGEFAALTNLTTLDLSENEIVDISALEGMTNLIDLHLSYNRISNLSALMGSTGLTRLRLGSNEIVDISPLAGLKNLTLLHLQANQIEDISPLAELTNLTRLFLHSNRQIEDISALASLSKLQELVLRHNRITNVSALASLADLTLLALQFNQIEDISPITGLNRLELLWLEGNHVGDIGALAGLTNLTRLDLRSNLVADISPLDGLANLAWLDLGGNQVEDISAISGLIHLAELFLADNLIQDLAPLVSNEGLGDGDTIDVSGNPLSDESYEVHIPLLEERGVDITFPLRLVDQFPDSRLTHVYNDNVMVMQVDEDVGSRGVLDAFSDYATDFYHWFEDEFDYLMFLSIGDAGENIDAFGYFGIYSPVMNDTKGIGRAEFFNSSYGSAGRLRGVIHFPYQQALISGPALHELLHAWANHAVPTAVGGHWGFSSADGQLGGFNIDDLEDLGGGRWTAGSFGTFANGGNGVPYSPIELYLAGLIPREEVPDLWVAEDGEWLVENGRRVLTEAGASIFTASNARTYSMADLVAEHGEREPAMVEIRHQRAAVVLLINDSPPTENDLQTLSEHATWLGMQGDDGSSLYNYYEATGGRATLSLGGLSEFQKITPSAPKNLPTSFGEPPPPQAILVDGVCGPLELN